MYYSCPKADEERSLTTTNHYYKNKKNCKNDMKKIFITHINRPFVKHKDLEPATHVKTLPYPFHRTVDYYSEAPEQDGKKCYYHYKDGELQKKTITEDELKQGIAEDTIIALPSPVERENTLPLWHTGGDLLAFAPMDNLKEEAMEVLCKTQSYGEWIKFMNYYEQYQMHDLVVITHLLTPLEGYPTEPGVLRAMTYLITPLKHGAGEKYHFGRKEMFLRDASEKMQRWEKEGRLIKLEVPVLFNPGRWNVDKKDLGLGFWTDASKKHHYGKVPKEAKCVLYTHVEIGNEKPLPDEIVRRGGYRAVDYLLDVGLLLSSSYSPDDDRGHEDETDMRKLVEANKVIPLPSILRKVEDNYQFWAAASGNIYLAHAMKPNEHPHRLILNTPLIAELPAPKNQSKYIQHHDFEQTAVK